MVVIRGEYELIIDKGFDKSFYYLLLFERLEYTDYTFSLHLIFLIHINILIIVPSCRCVNGKL